MKHFDPARRQVYGPRGYADLSPDQYTLLLAVSLLNPGEVTTYDELIKALYGCDKPGMRRVFKPVLEALIRRTRGKLAQVGVSDPERCLETRRGHGLTIGDDC